uniref:Reverse transcriptase/retrotransposon-derived protein RNase H-like domain-containing protein n=1 Tax=Strigamia maritima TaxID=126957 RepID=T1J108_STRMM
MNSNKTELCQTRLEVLGHTVEAGRIIPNPKKVAAIQKYPPPTNLRELQRFKRMIGYYQSFITNFSKSCEIFRPLLKKDAEWLWDEQHQKVFEELKEQLAAPTLQRKFPNWKKPYILQTDASYSGLGAALMQLNDRRTHTL